MESDDKKHKIIALEKEIGKDAHYNQKFTKNFKDYLKKSLKFEINS
ncbi:MAG: hypothetical protein R3255_01755 [Candidatus Lokiarchaeia archaeon]|nr:hypothetical protein [Candidatus Lokiarchaeia archaeon]